MMSARSGIVMNATELAIEKVPSAKPAMVNNLPAMLAVSPTPTPASRRSTVGTITSPASGMVLPSLTNHGPALGLPGSRPTTKAKICRSATRMTVFR